MLMREFSWILIGLILVLLIPPILFFLVFYREKHNLKQVRQQLKLLNKVILNFHPSQDFDHYLTQYLQLIRQLVEANGYYFYLLDQKTNSYILRVSLQQSTSHMPITPSYSGLVPYEKEKYNPPLNIARTELPSETSSVTDGQVQLLHLPIQGGLGFIRVGPIRNIPAKIITTFNFLSQALPPVLETALFFEKMKSSVDSITETELTLQNSAKPGFDIESSLKILMGLSAKVIEASGYCLVTESNGQMELIIVSNLENKVSLALENDQEGLYQLFELVSKQNFVSLNRDSKDFYRLPYTLISTGVQSAFLLNISGNEVNGTALFWHHKRRSIEEYRFDALMMLAKRITDVFEQSKQLKEMSNSYVTMLKVIVDKTDNLVPYTVGRSELSSRYCGIIARELGLPNKVINEVIQSAYFHNIGMLGLPKEFQDKSSHLNSVEDQMTQLHANLAALMIDATIANSIVSSYLLHHHEHWDGSGYPNRLKGEEIPLGSRILAVVEMFTDKLTERNNHEGITFEQAVLAIQNASGSKLDPQIVNTLINWFRKKEADPTRLGRALGPCWEMRCSPEKICKTCPSFGLADKNCWDIKGINCSAHGNSCDTCFIRTETVYRSKQAKALQGW